MRIADADGQTRLARAIGLLRTDILPALDKKFRIELFTIGDALVRVDASSLDHATSCRGGTST